MRYVLIGTILLILSCETEPKTNNPILLALESENSKITKVLDNWDAHEVQIKLSVIEHIGDSLIFKEFEHEVNDSNYFYPASSVKFPISVLAVEKLEQQGRFYIDTPFFVEGDTAFTTFRHDIRDIFAVSSNETYNRLFEYLGKDYINEKLKKKGLQAGRISHRLSTTEADELTTRPIVFMEDTILTVSEPIINKPIETFQLNRLKKGKGFYRSGELVSEPMDFSEKNYLPISTLHEMMKRMNFPELYPVEQRFNLSDKNRTFLLEAMAIYPRDEGYTSDEYFDGYGKFFIYGDTKESIPDYMTIRNKVGYAYGYLTDCAYIKDDRFNLEYILTATIHVNEDGIFNDDVYEYDETGLPFLAEFGRELHQNLINQKKP